MIKKYSQLYFAGATQQQIDAVVKKLNIPQDELLYLANEADPTKENRFEAWLIKQMGLKKIQLPGQQKEIYNLLNTFIDLSNKRQLQEKDINKYSYENLQQEIKNIRGQDASQSDAVKKYLQLEGVGIFGQNEDWLILRSEDPESSSILASGTKWCTSDPDVAEDYEILLICFEKAGSHLTKRYQLDYTGADIKDIQDNKPDYFPDSLAELIIAGYKTNHFNSGYLAETIKSMFISGWKPNPERAKEVISSILSKIHTSEIYDTIEQTNQHDFRDAFLQYEKKMLPLYSLMDLLQEYFTNWYKKIPRWKEFEQAVLKDKQMFNPADPEVLRTIHQYLAAVETEERIPLDKFEFNFKDKDYAQWARDMFDYMTQFLETGKRLPDFEKYIEKLIKKIDPASIPNVATLIAEYWIRVAKKEEQWIAVEDFLIKSPDRGSFGSYSHPYDRYVQAVRG